ncbi:hypothetical protein LPA44_05900 [Halobacterium sp. KA-4]|uniref:hypothetical protein n=1 Tax=Halobacterium sp. KA-4 TaxID=2896367 RepID=UPI001E39FEAF|nr:hypothetical protein [Halobacterium sp. KA-4]MCD2199430.1 hypothetical protein [Halobacterium sp. KA-4]
MLLFDDETVARVASDSGVPEPALREAVESVQATLDDFPSRSVDGLVYEWRQAFRDDPLVERRPDTWILRVPERVWVDIRERADVPDDLVDALVSLYETEADATEDGVALVIARDSASE